MALEFLDVYLDASGKRSSAKDKLITVNGCLNTPQKWREFDAEWQEALRGFGFEPYKDTGRYVFHTTDFLAGYCKLAPKGITADRKQKIYRHLVQTVANYSLYKFGYGILLKDYEAFRAQYPSICRLWFGQPGTMVSVLSVGKCIDWAVNHGFSKSVSLIFDRGDEFWGEMSTAFRAYVKDELGSHMELSVDSLTEGNKAVYSPLQAADIIAWECRTYFTKVAMGRLTLAGINPRFELSLLNSGHSFFTLYERIDLEQRTQQLIKLDLIEGKTMEMVELERLLKDLADQADTKKRQQQERGKAKAQKRKAK